MQDIGKAEADPILMRDYLLLYINGEPVEVRGQDAFMPLSTYLRQAKCATGTKVVCEEGDCGACSVIVGRIEGSEINYRPINSCIQFLYQLDCAHIITIEGLSDTENPVQDAMVSCHGAQCGYCTPGFVVTMCAMFDRTPPKCEQDVKDALTGNLCRCTGYEPIIKAGLSVDNKKALKLHQLYPPAPMQEAFAEHARTPVQISTAEHIFCNPANIEQAIRFKTENPGTTIVAGGTDVSVYWNKRGIKPRSIMSVSLLDQLRQLEIKDNTLVVGARTTLSELEDFTAAKLPELHKILWLFGSPQIRNSGTLAGNIANASPIADSPPFLFVAGAQIELAGGKGTRLIDINNFYKGYKSLDMQADEIIVRILIPIPPVGEIIKLYKVSKRRHLDISAFTAAFRLKLDGDTISAIRIAYGGVAATVVRLPKTEAFLTGKMLSLPVMQEAAAIAQSEITPISDVRGSSDFRNILAENILEKLYFDIKEPKAVSCPQ